MKKTLFFIFVILVLVSSASCTQSATKTQVADIGIDREATVVLTEVVEATEAPATSEPAAVNTESVVYTVPKNAIPLIDGKIGAVKGFFYVLNKEDPYTAEYPYQSLVMITLGNGKIEIGKYSEALTASETEGNIFADVCAEVGGCSAVISGYTAGHVGITVIFAGYENPDDSLIGGIKNMFEPSNCGGSGCNTIFAHNIKGNALTFEKKANVVVAKFLTPAESPYASVNFRYDGVPSGAIVIRDDAKNIIGHEYFLTDKDAFVSVPEGGGTLIYCGAKATIDDVNCPAGTAMLFKGIKSDGATPSDLNYTINLVTTDSSAIRVVMIYAAESFEGQIAQFKAQYPDWDWPE